MNISWLYSLANIQRNEFLGARTSRSLFLANNAYIGLAPAHAWEGDEICLLFGGDVPYVVRKGEDHYQLIGECYCYGIMDGEAVGDGKDAKMYTFV